MKINGMEFNIDEKTVTQIIEGSVKNLVSAAAAAAVFSLLTEIVVNGIFAKRSTEIIIDGELPANLLTLGGKDNPKAVYITNKKHAVRIAPALIYALTAAVGAYWLREKKEKDFVIL